MLASTASTTATASTTVGLGILSEHNKLGLSGSCVVTTSTNQKTCNLFVTYTNAAGQPVIGIPVMLATMNAEGSFTSVTGPLLIKNAPGKVVQYSGRLLGNQAQDVASFILSADATNTLFVVLTPDGLRAQSNFASSNQYETRPSSWTTSCADGLQSASSRECLRNSMGVPDRALGKPRWDCHTAE